MNRKIGRKPDRKVPAPTSGERIVLTGFVHRETGREFAFCTTESNEGFLLGPEDMGSPDGGKDLAARCEFCKTKAGEAKMHWVEDFRTALFEGWVTVDTDEGDHVLSDLTLVKNLIEARGTGTTPPSKRVRSTGDVTFQRAKSTASGDVAFRELPS